MALADDIQALRRRVLRELNDAHDYYTDTKVGWRMVQQVVKAGRNFTIRNSATGTATTQTDLVNKARAYITGQLAEATFQQFISLFENFFFDFLRLWLMAYPHSLSGKKVDFKAILEASDKDAITLLVVNKELNEVLYERPAGWFAYLEEKVKLSCPSADEIDRIAEAKASRDVLAHNRGVAGKTYELKAGKLARYTQGDRIEVPQQYHREIWELLRKVIADISNAAAVKIS